MEKDFKKGDSNPDDSSGENDDQELASIEREMELMAKTQSLREQIALMDEEMIKTQKILESFGDSYSQHSPLKFSDSPLDSPIQESHDLTREAFENSPDSEGLRSWRDPYIASCEIVKELEKKSEEIVNKIKNFEEMMKSNIKCPPKSPSKASDNETKTSESDTRHKNAPESGMREADEGSSSYYAGKGKVAAKKSFRYKKRSKTASSHDSPGKEAENPAHRYKKIPKSSDSYESLASDSSVKPPEETFSSPESKNLPSQSSDAKLSKIVSPMKRKGSDFPEKTLDESSAGTSEISKLYDNRTDDDDNLELPKKAKLDDDVDKISKQYPTLTAILDQKNYESFDLGMFMNQTSSEIMKLNLPSTSGLSNVVESISNSEESSLASGNENTSLSEREDSFLPSGSDMSSLSSSESGESSLANANEDTSLSGNDDSQHFQS